MKRSRPKFKVGRLVKIQPHNIYSREVIRWDDPSKRYEKDSQPRFGIVVENKRIAKDFLYKHYVKNHCYSEAFMNTRCYIIFDQIEMKEMICFACELEET